MLANKVISLKDYKELFVVLRFGKMIRFVILWVCSVLSDYVLIYNSMLKSRFALKIEH